MPQRSYQCEKLNKFYSSIMSPGLSRRAISVSVGAPVMIPSPNLAGHPYVPGYFIRNGWCVLILFTFIKIPAQNIVSK